MATSPCASNSPALIDETYGAFAPARMVSAFSLTDAWLLNAALASTN
jgi:hypothetical protein